MRVIRRRVFVSGVLVFYERRRRACVVLFECLCGDGVVDVFG